MLKRILKSLKYPIHYKDDYIENLRKINAGMLHHGNILCFNYAIKNLPSKKPIVEIGTFCGLSANVITYFKRIHFRNNILITLDNRVVSDYTKLVGQSDLTYPQIDKYIKESLIKNLLTFSKNDIPYALDVSSDTFFDSWGEKSICKDLFDRDIALGGQISFAYIDGNHKYDFVERDFNNCDKYLENNGFILFDDSADFTEWEVRNVIKKVKKTNRYKIIMKNPNYLFQKIH
ncbi:class I SAM-dependent methyltransferase [Clostridium sp.]|uniref:class I SAM-dependent methyltransferase n=1 Tax=Clostridium sp. TaxID=1506 RepID=UPI00285180AC|nr:class I SAM-dependent methyltransferase [Clostridium sp.]MDR3596507.1 class I SAM-dependent methyltransferase [Clostridium sp.]